jgi:hypothetical protein
LINQNLQTDTQPYALFVYAIRSPYTKESYFRRLRKFFDSVGLCNGAMFEERCNAFVNKGRQDSNWAFNTILRFLQYQKERVERKEITRGTLLNHVKTIKMFCELAELVLPWKKITRGHASWRYAATGCKFDGMA